MPRNDTNSLQAPELRTPERQRAPWTKPEVRRLETGAAEGITSSGAADAIYS
jgi:hypothetical protein